MNFRSLPTQTSLGYPAQRFLFFTLLWNSCQTWYLPPESQIPIPGSSLVFSGPWVGADHGQTLKGPDFHSDSTGNSLTYSPSSSPWKISTKYLPFFLPPFFGGIFYSWVPVILLLQLWASSQPCPAHLGQLFPTLEPAQLPECCPRVPFVPFSGDLGMSPLPLKGTLRILVISTSESISNANQKSASQRPCLRG